MKLLILVFGILVALQSWGQSDFPRKNWTAYQDANEAGFQAEKLKQVLSLFQESSGSALLVIHKGRILLHSGPLDRRFRQASIRKSYLSSLFGIALGDSATSLDLTLKSLGINDQLGLTEQELRATVFDLLRSRSGIYHPAAYNLNSGFPTRGSKFPGEFWCYNNWDFNALGSIYKQQVGDLFEDFKNKIAKPIGMQHFKPIHGFYRYEREKSCHPAYLFRLSALDMARFGLLYLNHGQWNGNEILPAGWVQTSTKSYSNNLGPGFSNRDGYGFMWWTSSIDDVEFFFASGAGGQRIFVVPSADLVLVHLTDTYQNQEVDAHQLKKLLAAILDAQDGDASETPRLTKFKYKAPKIKRIALPDHWLGSLCNVYQHPRFGSLKIEQMKKQLQLESPIGIFPLIAVDKDTFYNRDLDQYIKFIRVDQFNEKLIIKPMIDEQGKVHTLAFYY